MAKIQLSRIVEREDSKRAYKVFVDGKQTNEIRSGETIYLETTPGNHEIKLKIDWCGSRVFHFTADSNKTVLLQCGNNVPKLFFLFRGFVGFGIVLFNSQNYLWLRAKA
ncbi:MAG: hypothetical protein IAF38_20500 [Bacteroidia bacterium]|nr:hypothetical protein [Bacteroidia bacterium]